MRFAVTIATILALGCVSSQAWADDRARSDEHFQTGARLYHEGDYSGAILELKAGYQLAPHPVFLVNIALAYAKLSNFREAAEYGRRAATEEGLEADPHAQTSGRAEAWNTHTHAAALADALIEVAENPDPVATDGRTLDSPTKPPRIGALGWTGAVVGGVGLASIAGGVVAGATLQDDREAYEAAAAAGDREEYERTRDRIDSTQSIGRVLLFGGAGLFAVGATLFVLDLANGAEVAATPNSVSLKWVF